MNNNFHYVAFLRGINVGGHALIPMAELKNAFEKMGFENVRTVLASGNVVFETGQKDSTALTRALESGLKEAFHREINVILRSMDDLKKILSSEPFRGITVTSGIQLYVTFLSEKSGPRTITLPYTSPQKEISLLHATPREVFSVLHRFKGKGTTDVMNIMKKEYGADITTRNWNTVLKVLK